MHNSQMLDWNDLRYFLAVARQGSTLAAARAITKSQSTVHRRLEELEMQLGRPLVKRHPTGYQLTPFGLSMLPYAEEVEQSILRFEQHQASIEREEVGVVRLTCPEPIMAMMIKAGIIDRFQTRYPNLRVEFVMSDKYLDLAKGDADVALRSGDTEDDALVGRKIADSIWAVYAGQSFIDRHGKPETVADIAKYPIAGLDESMSGHRLSKWLAQVAPHGTITSRNNSMLGMMQAIRSGLGLGALPAALGDKDPELVRILGPIPELTRAWRILAHPDIRKTPRVAAFFEFIASETDALRPILTG
ncbi:MAG: LysR family transcriptional regulator [Rhizobiaceae bacterium]